MKLEQPFGLLFLFYAAYEIYSFAEDAHRITPAYAGKTSKFGAKFDNFAEYAHGFVLDVGF